MSVYAELGVRPVINAAATLTRLGGSLMPPSVAAAMVDAARSFVDLEEMQRRVGERIAELTHNEAAYVSCGAAAGISLAVAACIAGTDPARIAAFPSLDGIERRNVIVHRSQRNGYDYAARQTGATLVEVGESEDELAMAIDERAAGVLWFAGAHYAAGALPLETVVLLAHRAGVPVLVDAAAQIPPISNLWHFTRDLGADIAIFSGGKGLRGPQTSGLVLGRRDLIEGCRVNGNPHASIGRPMKVGKEELAGLLAAVEWSLAQDEPATIARYEASVRLWCEGLAGIRGVTVERSYPSEAGQPFGRTVIRLDSFSPWTRDSLTDALYEQNPRIAVGGVRGESDAIALNPQTLEPGEDAIVLRAVRTLLESRPQSA
jgi:uncharacterized pyridoxal phosphate-dependent enzyme